MINPTRPYIYLTDKENKKFHRVNYVTGEQDSIPFDLMPERMTMNEHGELYITLVKTDHSPYIFDDQQEGAVVVYYYNHHNTLDYIPVDIDPYDIAVRGDYIYISSGSGQHTKLKSYSRSGHNEVAATGINDASFIEMHPTMDRIYSFSSDVSPIDAYAYNIDNGRFVEKAFPGGYDSPYHGDYPFSNKFAISPDGKYIYNYSGVILTCDAAVENDMHYAGKLDESFIAIAFDMEKGNIYTATNRGTINFYDYKTSKKIGTKKIDGNAEYLFVKNNQLIGIIKRADGRYAIKEISTNNNLELIPTVFPLPHGIELSDSAFNPDTSEVYLVDKNHSIVYAVNYENNSINAIYPNLPPERILVDSDAIFLTLLKMPHSPYTKIEEQQGAILAVFAHDKNIYEQIDVPIDPFDMIIDKYGYACISSGSGQWTSVMLYPQDKGAKSSALIRQKSFLAYNPQLNKVYAVSTDESPKRLSAYKLSKGMFEGEGVYWPYHGNYTLTPFIKVSPDGQYLFNGSGVILKCSANQKEDMTFVTQLDKSFTDVAFDLQNNTFYIGSGKNVYAYDYRKFKNTASYETEGEEVGLTYQNGEIIVLSRSDNGQYLVEKYNK